MKMEGSLINAEQKNELKRSLAGFLGEDEPLAPKTAFKTGGAAAIYLQPANLSELELAIKTLTRLELKFLVLGGGSNLLIADAGIRDRVVISLERGFKSYEIVGSDSASVMIRAAAGVRLATLIQLGAVGGYSGWESLAGIPGTLGGALAMNAGAYGTTIYDYVSAVRVLRGAELIWLPRAELKPVYRDGGLAGSDIIVATYFLLPRTNSQNVAARAAEIRQQRRQRLPPGRHAGSVFKNPAGDFAGRLLDKAGCKGLRCGGAQVSDQHANVIVAEKDATSSDITDLIAEMRDRVERHFGTVLEPEIRMFE
jgi:UDP-N-acetylmuramate dehydrogenase